MIGNSLYFAFRRLNNVRVTDDNISEDMEISMQKGRKKTNISQCGSLLF